MKIAIGSSDPRSSAGSYVVNLSVIFFAPFRRQALRCFDVLCLRVLVSAAQQDDDGAAPLHEIDSVARAMVDSEFADSLADRLHIPCIPKGQAIKARGDQSAYSFIPEPYAPLAEGFGLQEID